MSSMLSSDKAALCTVSVVKRFSSQQTLHTHDFFIFMARHITYHYTISHRHHDKALVDGIGGRLMEAAMFIYLCRARV